MKKAVLGLTAALLIASAPAFALGWLPPNGGGPTTVSAPEIDVANGVKAVAALIAGLLLAAEGFRRRR